jgi:hypothetical protein
LALLLSGEDIAGHAQKASTSQALPPEATPPFTVYLSEGGIPLWDHGGLNE